MNAQRWWQPDRHADRRPALLARAAMMKAWRAFFASEGFIEIETAALQVSPGNETHIAALPTRVIGPDGAASPFYLHTSPEFAMKKLLAAGEPRLVSFARVFRDRDRGPLHQPEFTLCEWYRAGAAYRELIQDAQKMMVLAAEAAGGRPLVWRGQTCDPTRPVEHFSVAEAFERHAGIDLLATLSPEGEGDRNALARATASCGLEAKPDDSWSDLFSAVLTRFVEPHLGLGRPTVLDGYPLPEAALAQPSAADPRVAERFELYACGVELANAFGELTDPAEQRRRFSQAMATREAIWGDAYPIDDDFLDALALMPPASGIALGVDRLVLLATGAARLDDVIWTPVAGAGS